MKATHTISGHSFLLNALFVILNLGGLTLTTIGFHEHFEAHKLLFVCIGIGLMLFSAVALIFFKGRLMIATVSRVIVGSLFIVSGLIKANDPVGFSYKLEEYFEDGALAYRIKEFFGSPGFSLEYFIQHALLLSVLICIAEIVLGVLVIIGGKVKLVSWSLVIMMLFFTFLTWHTSTCDGKKKFVDRDTYSLEIPKEAQLSDTKIDEAKTNKDIKIISKNSKEVVVEELKSPQCVTDCGCFGDAMKGSVGRSLTPKESLWKDIVLLYLVIWIFAAQGLVKANNVRQNWIYIPISILLISGLSWVFNWYFPILFSIIALLASLWIYRIRNKFIGNHYGSALIVTLLCSIFIWFVLKYDPLRDYRAYATGNYLPELTKNGNPGKFQSLLVYKNLKTGATKEYDGSSKEFMDSKIWEKTKEWKYETMINKEIIPMILPSIDTAQFNPVREINQLSADELSMEVVKKQLKNRKITGLLLEDILTKEKIEISEIEYNVESYPIDTYAVLDTIEVENPDLTEVSIRNFLFTAPKVLVLVSKSLKEFDLDHLAEIKTLVSKAKKANVPIVFIVGSSSDEIESFKKKHNLHVPMFMNDGTELKVISRANPALMVLKHGRVKGKYTGNSLPTFNWIQTNLLK
ncbi:DoxX family membrane protein [Fluviicola taffensis]|uniref:DoxX family protein n=1 Tax=Fluviicola taffensis (strain DSM 16823 / NCIMB 13979 / RW262) TaxID=755732 RepID=F2I9G1_FLUTR|nr:DoxX family protein [Fluviicola taffensis DSM 16823]